MSQVICGIDDPIRFAAGPFPANFKIFYPYQGRLPLYPRRGYSPEPRVKAFGERNLRENG